ncbi:VWA domain-containing protein [Cutibacterium sp. WCA-380-WT-3A]|uniref:VWA domain-containing protein n=1 Tax=Cutibacterium porci TaxID=2605781 RepID=A0A7K0J9G0_9ACTN|nr:vWA domain-containing protein [Cutibacterium porci]MSS46617.1 VWA domain-containing protein [Cutibacterium porci]
MAMSALELFEWMPVTWLWPWAGLSVLCVALLACVVGWALGRYRPDHIGIPLAHVERLRSLPRWQRLVRRRRRVLAAELACWLVACAALSWTVARPLSLGDPNHAKGARDVVLCLDTSRSMASIDLDVIDSYLELVDELQGERIGLVAFDSSALTVFPLTSDADYVKTRLTDLRGQLGQAPIPGTEYGIHNGFSLVGDGLMACVNRFDRLDEKRSRNIVLATDNLLSGNPMYTLDEAARAARRHGITVHAVAPAVDDKNALDSLSSTTGTTGGSMLKIAGGAPANVEMISRQVESQARSTLPAEASRNLSESPMPGIIVFIIFSLAAELLRRKNR